MKVSPCNNSINMIKDKITISAEQLSGGPVSMFEGMEDLPRIGSVLRRNVSSGRMCVKLADNEISGEFDLEKKPLESSFIFRIRGMWDMYRELSELMLTPVRLMDTTGVFEVFLNGSCAYNGKIIFWNYRRWRFWPSIDIRFPDNLLRSGINCFTIKNRTRPFKEFKPNTVSSEYLSNTAYQISDIQILLCDDDSPVASMTLPDNTFLGHMIGGHNSVHLENDDFSHAIDLFKQSRQGNLIVFLMYPGKTNYDIDLDLIDTESIIRSGLYVALRYYGNDEGATIPERKYAAKLQSFSKRLGKNFLGFGPHEQHGLMSRVIKENLSATDISVYSRAYIDLFADRVRRIKEIRDDVPIWDTDPSFYSHFHLKGGASFPAVELCVQNASIDIASARGAAKAFGKDMWAAINSFECQAYGGLGALDREAAADPMFKQRRSNLWWLTQHLLYIGGARIIYSESGMFEHRVTLQKEFDDGHLCELRATQTELIKFADTYKLQGQPLANIAYLQGNYDIYKGGMFYPSFVEAMGNSLYSWKNLEVCFPAVNRHIPANENLAAYKTESLAIISDTPYGEADILPVDANADVMGQYKVLITSGWHSMDTHLFKKLEAFVGHGGVLVMLLPHMTSGKLKRDPCSYIDDVWLERLCGVRFSGQQDKDMPLNRIQLSENMEKNLFPSLRKYLKRNKTKSDHSGTLMKRIILAGSAVSVIAEEEKSGLPFLIKNKIGSGSVFLFNIADFPSQEQTYQLINAALVDIIDNISFDVSLKQGKRISFYLYPVNIQRQEYRLFVLNNDWFGTRDSTHAVFHVFGRELSLHIPKRQVIVADVSPG